MGGAKLMPAEPSTSLELLTSHTGGFIRTPFHEIPLVPWRDWALGGGRETATGGNAMGTMRKFPISRAIGVDPRSAQSNVFTLRQTPSVGPPPRRQGSPYEVPPQVSGVEVAEYGARFGANSRRDVEVPAWVAEEAKKNTSPRTPELNSMPVRAVQDC